MNFTITVKQFLAEKQKLKMKTYLIDSLVLTELDENQSPPEVTLIRAGVQ